MVMGHVLAKEWFFKTSTVYFALNWLAMYIEDEDILHLREIGQGLAKACLSAKVTAYQKLY